MFHVWRGDADNHRITAAAHRAAFNADATEATATESTKALNTAGKIGVPKQAEKLERLNKRGEREREIKHLSQFCEAS